MLKKTILIIVSMASMAAAAEPAKTIDQLLADRAAVQEVMAKVNKEWTANREAFMQLPATKEFNAKQGKLQQAYQESDKRLKEIDSLIAAQVAREKGK